LRIKMLYYKHLDDRIAATDDQLTILVPTQPLKPGTTSTRDHGNAASSLALSYGVDSRIH